MLHLVPIFLLYHIFVSPLARSCGSGGSGGGGGGGDVPVCEETGCLGKGNEH